MRKKIVASIIFLSLVAFCTLYFSQGQKTQLDGSAGSEIYPPPLLERTGEDPPQENTSKNTNTHQTQQLPEAGNTAKEIAKRMIEKIIVTREEQIGTDREIVQTAEINDQTIIEQLQTHIANLPKTSGGPNIDWSSDVSLVKIAFVSSVKSTEPIIPPYSENYIQFYNGLLMAPDTTFFGEEEIPATLFQIATALLKNESVPVLHTTTSPTTDTELTLPANESTDMQVKVSLQAKNYSTVIQMNGKDTIGTTFDKPDNIPSGGEIKLISQNHSIFSDPEAKNDLALLKAIAQLNLGDNTMTITYEKVPGADDASATISIMQLATAEDDAGPTIYEAHIEEDERGSLTFPFSLPYTGNPVRISQ